MKEILLRLRDFLIRIKLYIGRTAGYIALVNTMLILFLFLSDLEKYGIDVRIENLIVPLFIVGILGMIFFGYLEDKLGFYSHEQHTTQSRSPVMMDIVERLDRIEKKLEKKKR